MQQLLVEILPWLLAFYLLDGVVDVRRGQFVLSSAWGGSFRLLRSGLHHLGWSPTAEAIAAVDLPWLTAASALLVFDPRRRVDLATIGEHDVNAIPWSDVVPEAIGKKVRSRGRTLSATLHHSAAARLAADLDALVATGTSGRSPAESVPSPSPESLAEVRRRQRWWRRGLKVVATLLFVCTFALAVLSAYDSVHGWPWVEVALPILAILVGAELVLAVGYIRAAGGSWTNAASQASWLVIWPVAALHPLLHLSFGQGIARPALETAAAVLPPGAFRELAATEFGRAEVSLQAAVGPLAEALDWRARAVAAIAGRAGITERQLRLPPKQEATEGAWCPTCRSRFVEGTARCPDCRVSLRRFDSHRDAPSGNKRHTPREGLVKK
jgi:hypothetical protein